jgi:hypothetical protein
MALRSDITKYRAACRVSSRPKHGVELSLWARLQASVSRWGIWTVPVLLDLYCDFFYGEVRWFVTDYEYEFWRNIFCS